MTIKCTGAEYKRFISDKEYWPEDAYMEDEEILIDGVEKDPYNLESNAIDDTANVSIFGGNIYGITGELTVETFLRRWLKKQKTCSFIVEVDKEKREELEKVIKDFGAKILK